MKFIFKALLWIIALAAIGYGAWYAYNLWWGTGSADQAGSSASTAVQNIETAAKTKISEVGTNVASSAVASVGSFVGSTIGNLLSGLGGSLQNAGASISGDSSLADSNSGQGESVSAPVIPSGPLLAPTSSAFSVPPPPVTVMTKVNVPLSFSVNSGTSYDIDWGDGTTTNGATAADKVTVIDHAWNKEGDYTVQMTIGENNSANVSSFPVRVYQ